MICEWWIEKDVQESGRGLIWGIILGFDWRDGVKPRKPLAKTAGLLAKIWTRDLSNT
jgi:hypothetical protein